MTDVIGVRRVVVERLNCSPAGVLGSALAHAIRREIPDFKPVDFGARNLKEFLSDHVPEAVIAGRSGADVVYSAAHTQGQPLGESDENSPARLWATWATPSSKNVVDVSEDGRVALALASDVRGRCLKPLEEAGHRRIATAFLDQSRNTLNSAQTAALESALAISTSRWWIAWVSATRTAQGTNALWMSYRFERLREQLTENLRALGIDDDAVGRASATILDGRGAAVRRPSASKRQSSRGRVEDLRVLVQNAVRMFDEEALRRVQIPAGVVLDLLRKREL